MSNNQPTALRIAKALGDLEVTAYGMNVCDAAAAELRRLHEANQELLVELKKARLYIAGHLSVFLGEISENVAPDPLLNFAAQNDQALLDGIDAAIAKAEGQQ